MKYFVILEKNQSRCILVPLWEQNIHINTCVQWSSVLTSYCATACEIELEWEERLTLKLFLGKQFSNRKCRFHRIRFGFLELFPGKEFPSWKCRFHRISGLVCVL